MPLSSSLALTSRQPHSRRRRLYLILDTHRRRGSPKRCVTRFFFRLFLQDSLPSFASAIEEAKPIVQRTLRRSR
ncbi:hypothetical protein M407DRAFT_244378 [Tulasnella calospora MUT 4182]|uniref:Uncharacterized protein n=1 Tax=Tulasnella calospora MUT 4182 TaxID=1051891 RepID=A0A0C3Q601_9AGAM|nr:hypothetical protein M407DRAFT_244378 [Tulasnella calospora MUT 4182]